MSNKKQCRDVYGERLNVGDEVIPVLDEALLIGIGGFISNINYSEKYKNHYITITDKDGNILLDGVDAGCYTTPERFDEKEKQDSIYRLTFFDDELYPITSLPLTNRTDENYEIPDETCLVLLNAEHLTENHEYSKAYTCSTIYNFIVENDIKLHCDKHDDGFDFYYVMNKKRNWYPIYGGYRTVQNEDELKECVKEIIRYFREANLSNINNDTLYDENDDKKAFEKKLVYTLDSKI